MTTQIRADQYETLVMLSKRTGQSQAEYVRQALDLLFVEEKVRPGPDSPCTCPEGMTVYSCRKHGGGRWRA